MPKPSPPQSNWVTPAFFAQPTKANDWRGLHLLNLYRLLIVALLMTPFIIDIAPEFLGYYNRSFYLFVGSAYLALTAVSIITIHKRYPRFQLQALFQVTCDIVALVLLMHSSGGLNSGVGMLMIVAVTFGGLLLPGRFAFFFAAIASLLVLAQVAFADWYRLLPHTSYTHAGMLGIAFFATALLSFTLARRSSANEILAKQRGEHVKYLSNLNEQIVQHIQSGIIVVDSDGRVRSANRAAQKLLGIAELPIGWALHHVQKRLADVLDDWQHTPRSPIVFRPEQGDVDLLLNFSHLQREDVSHILLVLEDATLTTQRAQQLKLASLGRLTASIAHEIRNPLAAISQASQLLAESANLQDADRRLSQIITEHTKRVNTTIENVLQLSRRHAANTETIWLREWLDGFVAEFIQQHDLQAEDIGSHHAEVDLFVRFDPSQLRQLLTNLCENGLRYSHKTPRLALQTGLERRPYVDIRDFGTGMNESVAAQVFEPFFTTEASGSGLGLYLSREISEANQAILQLLENTPAGCCFRLYFTPAELET